MIDIEAAKALLARMEVATEPDPQLDWDILDVLFLQGRDVSVFDLPRRLWSERRPGVAEAEPFTGSIDATINLTNHRLPHFWQTSGLCAHSGHASIGPDYNGPERETLKAEWPEDPFHNGFHADLKPGDGQIRQCLALLHCLLQAEIARAEMRGAP